MEPSTPFPFHELEPDGLDGSMEMPEVKAEIERRAKEITTQSFKALAYWITDGGKASLDKAGKRSYIFAWGLVENLKSRKQKGMACKLNMNFKQEFGREVTSFTKLFGNILPFQQTKMAHEACVEREREERRIRTMDQQNDNPQKNDEHGD